MTDYALIADYEPVAEVIATRKDTWGDPVTAVFALHPTGAVLVYADGEKICALQDGHNRPRFLDTSSPAAGRAALVALVRDEGWQVI